MPDLDESQRQDMLEIALDAIIRSNPDLNAPFFGVEPVIEADEKYSDIPFWETE